MLLSRNSPTSSLDISVVRVCVFIGLLPEEEEDLCPFYEQREKGTFLTGSFYRT